MTIDTDIDVGPLAKFIASNGSPIPVHELERQIVELCDIRAKSWDELVVDVDCCDVPEIIDEFWYRFGTDSTDYRHFKDLVVGVVRKLLFYE